MDIWIHSSTLMSSNSWQLFIINVVTFKCCSTWCTLAWLATRYVSHTRGSEDREWAKRPRQCSSRSRCSTWSSVCSAGSHSSSTLYIDFTSTTTVSTKTMERLRPVRKSFLTEIWSYGPRPSKKLRSIRPFSQACWCPWSEWWSPTFCSSSRKSSIRGSAFM